MRSKTHLLQGEYVKGILQVVVDGVAGSSTTCLHTRLEIDDGADSALLGQEPKLGHAERLSLAPHHLHLMLPFTESERGRERERE